MASTPTPPPPAPAPSAGCPAHSPPSCPPPSLWQHRVSSLLTCSLLAISVLGLTPFSPQAATSSDVHMMHFSSIHPWICYHLWLVKPSVVIIGDNPKEFVVEELVIRDCFKELLHVDEESSGSAKNDGNKQCHTQPHQLENMFSEFLLFWWNLLGGCSLTRHLHQRLCSKRSSITSNNGRVLLNQLL